MLPQPLQFKIASLSSINYIFVKRYINMALMLGGFQIIYQCRLPDCEWKIYYFL